AGRAGPIGDEGDLPAIPRPTRAHVVELSVREWVGYPPNNGSSQSWCHCPPRYDAYTRRVPSGETSGRACQLVSSRRMSSGAPEPSAAKRTMSPVPWATSRLETKTIDFPSGVQAGLIA